MNIFHEVCTQVITFLIFNNHMCNSIRVPISCTHYILYNKSWVLKYVIVLLFILLFNILVLIKFVHKVT
jgi:hypothetical protein